MKKTIYLSYDLSYQGDYSNLYKWLAVHEAIECGDSFCKLQYDFSSRGKDDCKVFFQEVRKDLMEHVEFSVNDRVYVIMTCMKENSTRVCGSFIIGKRHQANPWDNYVDTIDSDDLIFDE